jgi:hypothetical protein
MEQLLRRADLQKVRIVTHEPGFGISNYNLVSVLRTLFLSTPPSILSAQATVPGGAHHFFPQVCKTWLILFLGVNSVSKKS